MADSIFGKIGDFLGKNRPWYKLPALLAAPALVQMRNELREKNLHDTEEPPLATRQPDDPLPPNVKDQRTLDDIQLQLVKGDYERGVRGELARVEASISALGDPAALDREMSRLESRIAMLEQFIEQCFRLGDIQFARMGDVVQHLELPP